MKILVTGGAGFIGSHLVDQLVRAGHELVVLDNLSRGIRQNIERHILDKKIEFIEGDIRNSALVERACTGCAIVYHLAAQSNVMGAVDDMRYSFETNVLGTFNLLQAAKDQGVKRFIFSSSREAYGEAQYLPVNEEHPLGAKNAYGASKASAELYCRVFNDSSRMEIVVLRLSNVFGVRDFDRVIPIFLDNVRSGKNLVIYGGNQLIDFIPIPFVTKILQLCIDNPDAISGPINVGSGQGTTLFELGTHIMDLYRSKQKILVEPARSEEVVRYTADVNRLQSIFGIDAPTAPLEHLKEML